MIKPFPTIDLDVIKISPDVRGLISFELMKRHQVVPFAIANGRLALAMANPSNVEVQERIQKLIGFGLEVFHATPLSIERALKKLPVIGNILGADDGLSFSGESDTVRVIDKIFELAKDRGASDIHFEPQPKRMFVRFRIDGVLQTAHDFPLTVTAGLISRIKILCSMDITERRLPQDGQITTHIKGKAMDLRVSTMPGKYGEKVVIRLLDKTVATLDFGQMGMNPKTQTDLERLIDKPQGIILVTGPTGSGKSSSLYSALKKLRSPMKNIVTLEDPIEYELMSDAQDESGLTQVQMNSKIGFTFATALRATLRQDPDVIMVGEIRDRETAEVAMRAAMTGHLVFSTLHTNDSLETITRLRDIGVDTYLVVSAIKGVLAQRLLRLLCASCKESYMVPARVLKKMFGARTVPPGTALYRPKGCEACQKTGYKGRMGIFELMIMTDELKNAIHAGLPMEEIKKVAYAQGLEPLRHSGMDLVLQGLTTAEEVFRVTID